MEISELGEFGLINRLTGNLEYRNASTLKGVGDDCAVITPEANMQTVVTTDLLMEGVHFDKREHLVCIFFQYANICNVLNNTFLTFVRSSG